MIYKISLFILFFFCQYQNKSLDDLINYYSKIQNIETKLEILTYHSGVKKFENSGSMKVKGSDFNISIDNFSYILTKNKFYTISHQSKEINILDLNKEKKLINKSIIFYINPISFIQDIAKTKNYLFEEKEYVYKLNFTKDDQNFEILFEKNYKIKSINISYNNSEIVNKIVFKNIIFKIPENQRDFDVNLSNFEGYYINEFWRFLINTYYFHTQRIFLIFFY